MAVIEKYLLGTSTSVITTGMNTLTNNSLVASSAYDNTVGQAGDGYNFCFIELVATYGVAPTANTGVSVWFLSSLDDTNYEDGSSSITPSRAPNVTFPLRAVTTAQRIVRFVALPPGKMTFLLKNDGTGQSMAASGNTLKVRPVARQGV